MVSISQRLRMMTGVTWELHKQYILLVYKRNSYKTSEEHLIKYSKNKFIVTNEYKNLTDVFKHSPKEVKPSPAPLRMKYRITTWTEKQTNLHTRFSLNNWSEKAPTHF